MPVACFPFLKLKASKRLRTFSGVSSDTSLSYKHHYSNHVTLLIQTLDEIQCSVQCALLDGRSSAANNTWNLNVIQQL